MKEIYETPECNLISYVSSENLATSFSFDEMLLGSGNKGAAPVESSDISFDF